VVKVTVNGTVKKLNPGSTVQQLVEAMNLPTGSEGIAVAVEAEVLPRSDWQKTKLTDGQTVEILTAVQGG